MCLDHLYKPSFPLPTEGHHKAISEDACIIFENDLDRRRQIISKLYSKLIFTVSLQLRLADNRKAYEPVCEKHNNLGYDQV